MLFQLQDRKKDLKGPSALHSLAIYEQRTTGVKAGERSERIAGQATVGGGVLACTAKLLNVSLFCVSR